jgi:hypothetical protein
VYYYGQESNNNILVMELLERNIETVFHEETQTTQKTFQMMTVLLIADQMVSSFFSDRFIASSADLSRSMKRVSSTGTSSLKTSSSDQFSLIGSEGAERRLKC